MSSKHDLFAHDFDHQIKAYECHIADALFGLCYESLHAGDSLLDVGIGTGLSSQLFVRAGLVVSGIDGSGEMLKQCTQKGFARQLVEQELTHLPWPFVENTFTHVISCGVFHFLDDLEGVFGEIRRVHSGKGIFAFTIMEADEDGESKAEWVKQPGKDIFVYTHNRKYIEKMIVKFNFKTLKQMSCLVGETRFRIYCTQVGECF